MKKIFASILAITMLFCLFGCTGTTEDNKTSTPTDSTPTDGAEDIELYVTVATDGLKLAYSTVTVSDCDGDGTLTLDDAIYSAHEQYYEGGAAAGYKSRKTEYGLSLYKLWGEDNGGNYGYFINDTSAASLYDEVKAGDDVYVYAYQDTASFTDCYAYFDKKSVEMKSGEALELTLTAVSFDENWSPVTVPIENAIITIDGEATEYRTDADGKVTVSPEIGLHTLSSACDYYVLTPAVCIVNVTE